jgi:hypothetical protein
MRSWHWCSIAKGKWKPPGLHQAILRCERCVWISSRRSNSTTQDCDSHAKIR